MVDIKASGLPMLWLDCLQESCLPKSLNFIANASGSSPVTDKWTRCVLEHQPATPWSVYSWSGSLLSCSIFTFRCAKICPLRSSIHYNCQNVFGYPCAAWHSCSVVRLNDCWARLKSFNIILVLRFRELLTIPNAGINCGFLLSIKRNLCPCGVYRVD